jgi:hypothetical protein
MLLRDSQEVRRHHGVITDLAMRAVEVDQFHRDYDVFDAFIVSRCQRPAGPKSEPSRTSRTAKGRFSRFGKMVRTTVVVTWGRPHVRYGRAGRCWLPTQGADKSYTPTSAATGGSGELPLEVADARDGVAYARWVPAGGTNHRRAPRELGKRDQIRSSRCAGSRGEVGPVSHRCNYSRVIFLDEAVGAT